MVKHFGNALMLMSALVLFLGTQATWCDVYQTIGIETHHHHASIPHIGHHHHDHEDELPRDGDCSIELSEVSIPKELAATSIGNGVEAPTWHHLDSVPARSVVTLGEKPIPPPAHPPSVNSPPVLGCFLI